MPRRAPITHPAAPILSTQPPSWCLVCRRFKDEEVADLDYFRALPDRELFKLARALNAIAWTRAEWRPDHKYPGFTELGKRHCLMIGGEITLALCLPCADLLRAWNAGDG